MLLLRTEQFSSNLIFNLISLTILPKKYQSPLESPLILEIKEGSNDLKIVLNK
ncbi:MAG: hypothetical protein LBC02_03605 [Planctomycetaceae bacterium]|nr:hypothetical protein [Planctomycetaceae bacterium]